MASWIDEGKNKYDLPKKSDNLNTKSLEQLNSFKGFGKESGNDNLYEYRAFNNN